MARKVIMLELGPFARLFDRVRGYQPAYSKVVIFNIAAEAVAEAMVALSSLGTFESAMNVAMGCLHNSTWALASNGGIDISEAVMDDADIWRSIIDYVANGIELATFMPKLDAVELEMQDGYLMIVLEHV